MVVFPASAQPSFYDGGGSAASTVSSVPSTEVISGLSVKDPPAEAWWTGPIFASSAETLPRGHVLLEPYVFDVRYKASDYAGSLTYILVGATDNLTIGAIPTFGSMMSHGGRQARRLNINDLTLTTQFRLVHGIPNSVRPSVAAVVQRNLPLGRYDRLERNADLGIGSGRSATLVGLYAQWVAYLPNGRPFRTRLNATYSFAPAVHLDGTSVYGTPPGFRGKASGGGESVLDLSTEYSITRNFVLANDLTFRSSGRTFVMSDDSLVSQRFLPHARSFSIAPAVEYSWTATRGALIGVRVTPKAAYVPASITPVMAFNAVF